MASFKPTQLPGEREQTIVFANLLHLSIRLERNAHACFKSIACKFESDLCLN